MQRVFMIKLSHINKYYWRNGSKQKILSDITITIEEHASIAVLGASGCGKSTLARLILGFEQPDSGSIHYNDVPLQDCLRNKKFRRNIQLVSQDPMSAFNPHMPIDKALIEPLHIHNLPLGNIQKTLTDVGLSQAIEGRLPRAFSGGQRQRLAIARALLLEPSFLVADEVTSALDVSVQAQVINLLYRLNRERGLGLIFITHNLAIARGLCQHAIVIENGCIVESGLTAQIFENPTSDYGKRMARSLDNSP